MKRWFLHAKIHEAKVTQAEIDYVGSITIDPLLLRKTGLHEGEKVLVVCKESGVRLETYIIVGKEGKGEICMNGPAAKLINKGDTIIIMGFALSKKSLTPKAILVDEKNQFLQYLTEEAH